jgi:hypothetical protein
MTSINWKQVQSYPGRLFAWLEIGWLPITALSINLVAISFAWFCPEYVGHENHVRIAAIVLQVCGWLGVFKGVLDTRAQFGLPKIRTAFSHWRKSFPALFPKPIVASMSASLDGIGLVSTATASNTIDQDASLDLQMRQVIAAIEQLRKDDHEIRTQLGELDTEVRAAIDNERRARDDEVKSVRTIVTSHATGGINLTLCGAVCFLVGGVLGTLPYSLF